MKKSIVSLFFAVTMMFSMTFVGGVLSENNPFSVKAQTATVKKKRVGAIRSAYRGGKYIGKQVWTGTKWVGVKTYQGSKYVGKKTWQGTKYAGKKTAKGAKWVGRKVY